MGELGPELVVQQGRYFVAGQAGAEFVDLAPDAIVFNHLQTEQLLKNGMSSERGRAVTNERVAAAYAHGNMNGGPAMASASAALAALKQLRSMWQSLLNASVRDLAGAGGGGGGGGGKNAGDYGHYIEQLEKWYNWLQEIAELETKINYEEARRSKIASDMVPHGQDYAKSQLRTLELLKEQRSVQEDLVESQQEYFDKRVKDLNDVDQNPFATLYKFDEETGQLKYQNKKLEDLSKLVGTDKYGKANYDAKEMYEEILKMNPELENYMKYDSNGEEIDFYEKDENSEYKLDEKGNKIENKDAYTKAIEAFFSKMDADKEEMQSLHDSINEHKEAMLEEQEAMNGILKEIEDNQISVEDKVLKALEDSRQRAIDDAKDERDAIEKASNNLIDGLSDQLQKERDMYEKQESQDELGKLQRQLSILQRSGSSAAQIASLESQISDKMKEAYFDAQQDEIDALQEATDAQLEKLDTQISIMEETLAYEKENGLLWGQVYEIMQGSPEEIAQYIKDNDSSLWSESPAKTSQTMRETLETVQQFTEIRDSVGGLEELIKQYTNTEGDDGSNDHPTEGEKPKGEGEQGQEAEYMEAPKAPPGVEEENPEKDAQGSKEWKVQVATMDGEKKRTVISYLDGHGGSFTVTAPTEDEAKVTAAGIANERIAAANAGRTGKKRLMSVSPTDVTVEAFKHGGLVDYTGLIQIDGTKQDPEGILSGEDVHALRAFWERLNHDRDELAELRRSMDEQRDIMIQAQEAVAGVYIPSMAEIMNESSGETIVIQHQELNMNVERLANDYDAERAGQQVMNEMLRIAKKSKGWNRVGR